MDHAWCNGRTCVDLAANDEDKAYENADNWSFAALHVSRFIAAKRCSLEKLLTVIRRCTGITGANELFLYKLWNGTVALLQC